MVPENKQRRQRNLSFFLSRQFQGKYEKAETLYVRALAIWEKAYGPDHPVVATDLNNWALLLVSQVRTSRRFV